MGGVLGPVTVGVISGVAGLDVAFYVLACVSAALFCATFVLKRSAIADAARYATPV